MNACDHKVGSYPLLSSEKIWQGLVFGLREDTVQLPGSDEPVVRQYLDHPGAVAVVALRGSKVLLLEQYRHPVKAKLWELPAGLLDVAGEDYLEAAKRELREEADLEGGEWNVLVDLFTSPGASSESLRVFLVREPVDSTEVFPRTEEEANMRPLWADLDLAVDGILQGRIHNPTAIAGVLAAARARYNGWRGLRSTEAPWMR